MNVYVIHTTRRNPRGEPIYINFGCDIPDLATFVGELNKGRAIYGEMLRTAFATDAEGKHLVVTGRQPYAIAPAGVTAVENPRHRFVEHAE